MSYYPKMETRVHEQEVDRLVLVVTHDQAQSFSRAVDPCALREARKLVRGDWALIDVAYAEVKNGKRCDSFYYFERVAA
jgi:hypothetical protein